MWDLIVSFLIIAYLFTFFEASIYRSDRTSVEIGDHG